MSLISLLFLTNFRLGVWIRNFLKDEPVARTEPKSSDEAALERRARDLERQAQKLQEEVARSGLGADMQLAPEPTVRDLSGPQAKSSAALRVRKTTMPGTRRPGETWGCGCRRPEQGTGLAPAGPLKRGSLS